MPKKAIKKLDPTKYTSAEYNKRYDEAVASGEIQLGEYLPELKPKAPQPK